MVPFFRHKIASAGFALGGGAFRSTSTESGRAFVQDLLDNYFPYELKEQYPDGGANGISNGDALADSLDPLPVEMSVTLPLSKARLCGALIDTLGFHTLTRAWHVATNPSIQPHHHLQPFARSALRARG